MADKSELPAPSSALSQAVEWVLALVCGVLVLTLFGFLAYKAITDTGGTPEIALRLVEIRQSGGQFFADVAVANEGHAAAAELEVIATVGESDQQQTSSAILDYAPSQSRKQVSLGFDRPVAAGEIKLMVGGYRQP
jgi:uncharacterized protein (TIGR02588 family)